MLGIRRLDSIFPQNKYKILKMKMLMKKVLPHLLPTNNPRDLLKSAHFWVYQMYALYYFEVALHFVPFHFVPGHFVPVISSPLTFRPRSFRPPSFCPLVISSPRIESTEFHIHTLQKLLQASYYMTNDLGMSCDNGDMCDTYVKCDNCYTCVCHCKYNLNILKWETSSCDKCDLLQHTTFWE
jgi:hypothetical protein